MRTSRYVGNPIAIQTFAALALVAPIGDASEGCASTGTVLATVASATTLSPAFVREGSSTASRGWPTTVWSAGINPASVAVRL